MNTWIKTQSSQLLPDKIADITHTLHLSDLFSIDNLVSLAKTLPKKQVRFHASTAGIKSSFERATEEHAHTLGLIEAVDSLETSGSWVALHNVQTVPEYRKILHDALEELLPAIEPHDSGLFHKAVWVFMQSPFAVTPYHMDHEQNFLMQIKGRKHAQVWNAQDVLSDTILQNFHASNSRAGVFFEESLRQKAVSRILEPGHGIFMPQTCPHLVENADNVSITVSFTYCSQYTRKAENTHRFNHALYKRFGIKSEPVGHSPIIDSSKAAIYNRVMQLKDFIKGEDTQVPHWARGTF